MLVCLLSNKIEGVAILFSHTEYTFVCFKLLSDSRIWPAECNVLKAGV